MRRREFVTLLARRWLSPPHGRLTFGKDKSPLIQSHSLIVRATLEFRQPKPS
jgi:hypothetical protein